MEHHNGATIYLRTLADAVTATPPTSTIRARNIWVIVDAKVDVHLTKRLAELSLHRAPQLGLTTQALGLWMAFRGMHPQDALHIVKQETLCYTYAMDAQTRMTNTRAPTTP